MLALADAAPGIAGLFEGKPALRGKAMLEQCAPQDQHIHPGISAPGHGVARQAGGCSPDTAPRLDPRDAAPFQLGNDPVRHLVIEVGARLCGRFPSLSDRARSEEHTSELQSLMTS